MANFSKPQSMLSMLSMLVTLFALLQFTLAFQHAAHQHMHRNVDAAIHTQILQPTPLHGELPGSFDKRQAKGRIAVTGSCAAGAQSNDACNSGGRTAAARIEIRDLANNADLWNLFLLGMERFQAKDKTDVLSYYQIAGIHGRPYVTWNGFPAPLVNLDGFCPHSMSLFGTWHRPYLAVYEQGLYQSVLEVISTFPSGQQQQLKNLASTLRIPYWDWADGVGVPNQISDQKVTVTKPAGKVQIDNPLYSYSWGSKLPDEMGGGPLNSYPRTLRRPISSSPPKSNDQNLNAIIQSMQPNLRDRIFALFSSGSDWGSVSTEAIGVKLASQNTDSFESLHDAIHSTFGGGDDGGEMGHMGSLDYSAFDPVFWLHHANIDRLLAMYQLMTPNTWVSNGNVNNPMAQWNVGDPKNGYSPLKPFTKDTSGTYFTSIDIQETRILGYYYPETEQRSQDQVLAKINNYRGDRQPLASSSKPASSSVPASSSTPASSSEPASSSTSSSSSTSASSSKQAIPSQTAEGISPSSPFAGRPIKAGEFHTVLEIIANKYAVKGSYTVHAYVGKKNSTTSTGSHSNGTSTASHSSKKSPAPYSNSTAGQDVPLHYTLQPNYVGSYGILGHSMGNKANQSVITSGSVPLTSCLQGKEASGDLKSLTPDYIEPYLKEHLYYKVVGPNGEMNPDDLPDFHISVKCTAATPAPNDNSLPKLSAPYQPLPKCTEGKPAGNPFTYTPKPIDIPLPNNATSSTTPYGSVPWQEPGYCASTNKIVYVDPSGNILSQ